MTRPHGPTASKGLDLDHTDKDLWFSENRLCGCGYWSGRVSLCAKEKQEQEQQEQQEQEQEQEQEQQQQQEQQQVSHMMHKVFARKRKTTTT